MHRPDTATTIPRGLMLTLSEEVSDLSASVASLQAALADVLAGAERTGNSQSIWHLQEIDRIQQTLDDIAAVLRHVGEAGAATPVELEAVTAVTRLGAVRARLRGSIQDAELQQQAGTVAMF